MICFYVNSMRDARHPTSPSADLESRGQRAQSKERQQRAESREHCREQAAESREQTAQSKNSKLTVDLETKNAAKMEVRRLKNDAEGRLLGTLGKGITLVWAARGTPRRRSERRSATGAKTLH